MVGIRTRIAPTPSGYLHVGNGLNFLLAHAIARESGGTVLLRIDDLDAERTRPAYVEDIFESLHWLGITWDEGPRDAVDFARNWSQTGRMGPMYNMLERLRDMGVLFACICSRKELAGCTCRDQGLSFDATGTTWRLRVPAPCPVVINDLIGGSTTVDLNTLMPDPVLRQRNGSPAYQLASLADDLRFGINVIVRGEDLLPSTACQLYLAALLAEHGFLDVMFLHHPLITDDQGRKLAKSEGADSLRTMRSGGISPDQLKRDAADLLARLRDRCTSPGQRFKRGRT